MAILSFYDPQRRWELVQPAEEGVFIFLLRGADVQALSTLRFRNVPHLPANRHISNEKVRMEAWCREVFYGWWGDVAVFDVDRPWSSSTDGYDAIAALIPSVLYHFTSSLCLRDLRQVSTTAVSENSGTDPQLALCEALPGTPAQFLYGPRSH